MDVKTAVPLPRLACPILIVGTGGIVKDAHLPAYRMAGFPVWGLYNRTLGRAGTLATEYGVGRIFDDLDAAIVAAGKDVIYDLALPASMFAGVLRRLPAGSHVLIQKPMGESFTDAKEILKICRSRDLQAAINCQLRFAPFVLAARDMIERGLIGELLDMEMRLTVHTPWKLFPFLEDIPRMEILYHSVHYIDLIRSFLGEPRSVMARTVPHPDLPKLASVRSTVILDYPGARRATVTANHCHNFGAKHQESYLKWEGTRGAIRARIGLLMNYPQGTADCLEYCNDSDREWREIPIKGSWFPEAFVGTMAEVQRHKEGSLSQMAASVEDVIKTMACVEAAYESDAQGGVRPEQFLTERKAEIP